MMQDRLRSWVLPLMALLACVLGGAREPWEQGVVLVVLGLWLFLHPISDSPLRALPWLGLASLLWAAAAFLPQALFPVSEARISLREDYGIPLAWTVTAQPWITLEVVVLLMAGWLWFLSACEGGWASAARRQVLRIWCGGVLVLLVVSALAWAFQWDIPGWDSPRGFGPFANRNQMGNLLALGGFFMIVLAYETREHQKTVPWFWLIAATATFAGLVANYSRAGIVLFFLAVGLWMVALILMGGRIPMALVAGSVGILFLAFFLVWGGPTLGRFFVEQGNRVEGQGRLTIQEDAWTMMADTPVLGVGGGNFEALFPFYREVFQSENRVLHPESDYLWLATEMGLPAVLLLAAAFAVVVWGMFPFAPRSDRQMRAACLVAGLVFAVHGGVDVSGHRMGTVLSALLLFSLGLPARREPEMFRKGLLGTCLVGALVLIVSGAVWIAQTLGWVDVPGRAARDHQLVRAEESISARQWMESAAAIDAVLQSAPLAWQGHYQQGRLALAAGLPEAQVRAAFLRARALEPNNPWIAYRAGLLWWEQGRRDLALSSWNDALSDSSHHRGVIFTQIAGALKELPGHEVRLAQMASHYPELRVYGLAIVPDEAFGGLAVKLLEDSRNVAPLGPAESKALFEAWERKAAEPDFEIFLEAHPEWMEQAWPMLARRLARKGDRDAAVRLLWQRVPEPIWPKDLDLSPEAVEKARLGTRQNPLNVVAVYVTAKDQQAGGRYQAGLETLLPLLGTESCPVYLHYLAAQFHHALGQDAEAYAALEKYRRVSEESRRR